MKRLIAAFILLTTCLAGCFPSSTPPSPLNRYYALDYPLPPAMKKWDRTTSIKIEHLSALPPFNSPNMVWQEGPYTREISRRDRWQAPPAVMVEHLLLRDWRHALPALIVLSPEETEAGQFSLEGKITEFLARKNGEVFSSRIALRVTVVDTQEPDPIKRIILQRSYIAEENLVHRSPAEMARAMSIALEKLNRELTADLATVISGRLGL